MRTNHVSPWAAALFLLLLPCFLAAQEKYALVIGNAAYTSQAPLRNTPNDAADMKAALEGLGFRVELVLNGSLRQMRDGVRNLARQLGQHSGSYGFFYYSGHGLQYRGDNYLVPVNADLKSEADLPYEALHAQQVLDQLEEAGNELNIVVLDACRNTPYGWSKSADKGLAVVGRQPVGSIVMYATGAGKTASDGNGRNGTFTAELLKQLKSPGLEVSEVFKRTGAEVSRVSGREQVPAVYLQYFGTAYLGRGPGAPQAAAGPQFGQIRAAPGDLEIAVAAAGTLNIQGGGLNRDVAFSGAGTLPVSGLEAGNYRLRMRYGDGKTEERSVAVEGGQKARVSFSYRAAPPAARPERPLPEGFVRIPAGTFTMGSPAGGGWPGSGPQHPVTVSSFSMSRYELSQREWKAVMGSNPSEFKGENLPVESVSWYDAIAYCNKRSEKEGLSPAYTVNGDRVSWNRSANGYRLPTEAEWEYACRAGTTTPFSTGNTITASQAKYDGKNTWNVGSGAANAWGLYDMHGNVKEWCWDWGGTYSSASQKDPVGPVSGTLRVLRGGSWSDSEGTLLSAVRDGIGPRSSSQRTGFRLVLP
ncbi:MAG: SUMF1/EgtB/PvdO family nonheme iron enzyme [Treponema sp.]|jgi:formylglycine-generating enzyme required for sulfatase activity|nr:SUMF1/EgtB/PvdO family nonheme iron enzyme [Treponema sp.]